MMFGRLVADGIVVSSRGCVQKNIVNNCSPSVSSVLSTGLAKLYFMPRY